MSAAGRRVGVWLVGARGSIATCVVYGLFGLRQGLVDRLGLVTATAPFEDVPLVGFDELLAGGHEVSLGTLSRRASELVRNRVLPEGLVAAAADHAAAYDARVRPGLLDGPDAGRADVDARSARLGGAPPREQLARLGEDLVAFREENGLERVVVVDVSSTEAWREAEPWWGDLPAFEQALDAGHSPPASTLYAYAALRSGMPYVNFTPNRGASVGALRALAREAGLPHCGSDGKTGETLLKTVLAPMFRARGLRVLAWQGYNMLGNSDGESLADPVRREAKRRNKDEALRSILGDDGLHSHVAIDYVPSLHDWKTALDYVHFEGFLGARMSLQLTWTGCDSALAAPLVIDLVRLADLAAARGETGEMEHVSAFFKAPLAGGTSDFHAQHERLLAYARAAAAPQSPIESS